MARGVAVRIGRLTVEPGGPLFVVAGPCVIESADHALGVAETLARIGDRLDLPLVFKSSFDKANRTSGNSPRGPGLDEGLAILARVQRETGLPVLTDVHETVQVAAVAEVADIVQIPAFLSRQTDLLRAAAATGRVVNIKKGQFMAADDMIHAAAKVGDALPAGCAVAEHVILTERGTSFGYHDLIVDMRSLGKMRATGLPTLFDASHSVQSPGGANGKSGGAREWIPLLSRAAAAAGVSGLFIETHPDPANAWSDSATVWPLDRLEALLADVARIHDLVRATGMADG
ncbi:MAG: 3-deoxy-8-phosphooctulonate synthase [Sphingomonas sp.]|uniref:3-deoxy-8-phosphooctulonate synthase n=1 Tax=Sphingomonas sp. TaxID=28214 RepID=UPI002619CECC|nr:3-deoxy-8-phosphooctulonate synthase [Sphingomonas sp.]MDK2768019.1 3-deoxy-8-phosphooctulonate synthase [Sphingomonas sp.]